LRQAAVKLGGVDLAGGDGNAQDLHHLGVECLVNPAAGLQPVGEEALPAAVIAS